MAVEEKNVELEKVAIIDCGTNSFRMLISEVGTDGVSRDLVREKEEVELGKDKDEKTNQLAETALQRAEEALSKFAKEIKEHNIDPSQVKVIATSAVRDAPKPNREDFKQIVRSTFSNALGGKVEPSVLLGDEEAELSFRGASRAAVEQGAEEPIVVVDIGGGSTEIILGDSNGIKKSVSLQAGSRRMSERRDESEPLNEGEIAAKVDQLFEASGIDLSSAKSVVLIGGTAETLAGSLNPKADKNGVRTMRLTELSDRTTRLATNAGSPNELAKMNIPPKRMQTVPAGAVILTAVLSRLPERAKGSLIIVSPYDIKDGVLAKKLQEAKRVRRGSSGSIPAGPDAPREHHSRGRGGPFAHGAPGRDRAAARPAHRRTGSARSGVQ